MKWIMEMSSFSRMTPRGAIHPKIVCEKLFPGRHNSLRRRSSVYDGFIFVGLSETLSLHRPSMDPDSTEEQYSLCYGRQTRLYYVGTRGEKLQNSMHWPGRKPP